MVDAALAALLGMMAGALWAAVAITMRAIWRQMPVAPARMRAVDPATRPFHSQLASRGREESLARDRDMTTTTAL